MLDITQEKFVSSKEYVLLKGSLSPPRKDTYGVKCHAGSKFKN